jgi:hypothetical protein
MYIAVAAGLLSLSSAQPDSPDLQCILDRIPSATRSALLDEAVAGASGPGNEALVAAAHACRTQRGWDGDTLASFGMLAYTYITGEQSRGRMERSGVDPDLIVQWFDGQDRPTKTTMPVSEAVMDALFSHLAASGISQATLEAQVTSIGAFWAALVMAERLDAGLPIE